MSNLIRLLFHGANFMHLGRTIKGPFRVHFPTDKVHFVTLCSGKTKKGSAALNRAILGPPLPYPIEVLDERQKKKAAGMEKTL